MYGCIFDKYRVSFFYFIFITNINTGHEDYVYAVAVSPNGELIASASEDSTVALCNVSGEHLLTFRGKIPCMR